MAGEGREGPVAEFCAGLRRMQQGSDLDRATLARRLRFSRSQLYEILDGRIRRPPEWDRLLEPLVRACTRDDERAVALWRRRHDVLVAVHSELIRQDRQGSSPPIRAGMGTARVVPAQLPGDVHVFTGRAAELAELDRLLTATPTQTDATDAAGGGSTSVVISAVSGTAGVGKTALALRWAHRVRAEFPDGQLYVNLRGYDPDQPLSATDALARFLRALETPGQDFPIEQEERTAAYRSLLDGRRILIVLDNAATVEQVRPLLPGTPSALVVVTSRDSLAGLVARDGARRLDLDLLPPEDAVVLLGALIGERVIAEPDAAAVLAGQCARLPLALRVAAELAATRPTAPLAALVAELADEQRRLELLDAGGDPRTAVRAVLSWSYLHLPAKAAWAFRLIGLHPGPDLDSYAAAALTHTSLEQAQHLLDLLARAHLIGSTSPGRYGMHDLLRAYASDRAAAEDSEEERRAVLTRLFDYYLATAAAAMNTLHPAEQGRLRIPLTGTPTPAVADPAVARAWLDAERPTLAATCSHTAAQGWSGHTTTLARVLFRYLEAGGHSPEALDIHTHALHAARDAGNQSAEAHALGGLGVVYLRQGRYQQAIDHLHQALALFREIGDRGGEASALGNLGILYQRQGSYELAVDNFRQILTLFREIGDRAREGTALCNLGVVYQLQGNYEQAADHHRQALILSREIINRTGEADALCNLGNVQRRQGHYEQAADQLQQALALSREIGYRTVEARVLGDLGKIQRNQGRYEQAADQLQQALALFREIGDQAGEAEALNDVGETHYSAGHRDQADAHHAAALTLATEIGDRYEQARAHNDLAHIHDATGELDQARHHWRQALALYTALDVPEADDVHAHLAALDQATSDK